jgi:hypothetical protein
MTWLSSEGRDLAADPVGKRPGEADCGGRLDAAVRDKGGDRSPSTSQKPRADPRFERPHRSDGRRRDAESSRRTAKTAMPGHGQEASTPRFA